MALIGRFLLGAGDAVLAAWETIHSGLGACAGAVDAWLDPVLSPLLATLNPPCTWLADGIYTVLSPLPIWAGLALLSAVTGVIMLVVFRYASNQEAIGRAKDDIKANLLALKLFKDDLGVTLRAQGRLFWAVIRLQRYVLTPVLLMLLPMLLGLSQMGTRYQWRPLLSGERTLVKMKFVAAHHTPTDVFIEPTTGVMVELGPIPGAEDLVWRIRGAMPGRHQLRFNVDGKIIEKEMVVGDELPHANGSTQRVSGARVLADWSTQLFHPIERRLPSGVSGASVESIIIDYPELDSWVNGSDWWLAHFFIVSMLTALIFKPLFRVKF
jgi:hypothetical protein